ncbi:MAG: hypothetical protein M1331_02225 [Candidatus Marsarchaeota archaeon]|nr:hypothetical protein [Candidatus Marsarchaeota archaeon]MCL5106191.1 hypothetical protein [Candidatus Marsarchaeota archaeon]
MFGIFKKPGRTTYVVEAEKNMPNPYNYDVPNAKVLERLCFSKKEEAEFCFTDTTRNEEVKAATLRRRDSYLKGRKIAVSEQILKHFRRYQKNGI